LICLDSSGWLQYFLEQPLADAYARFVEGDDLILVPAVVIYEVYKVLRRHLPLESADEAALHLARLHVAPLDSDLALAAAEVSLEHSLSFADAVIYAAAQMHEAKLVTSDAHFAALPGVTYLPLEDGTA
jgi:predicted nucleic acid-binding protein